MRVGGQGQRRRGTGASGPPGSKSRVGNEPGRDQGQTQTLLAFVSACDMQVPRRGSPKSLPPRSHEGQGLSDLQMRPQEVPKGRVCSGHLLYLRCLRGE